MAQFSSGGSDGGSQESSPGSDPNPSTGVYQTQARRTPVVAGVLSAECATIGGILTRGGSGDSSDGSTGGSGATSSSATADLSGPQVTSPAGGTASIPDVVDQTGEVVGQPLPKTSEVRVRRVRMSSMKVLKSSSLAVM